MSERPQMLDPNGTSSVITTSFDLDEIGYNSAEYSISGTATAFGRSQRGIVPVDESPFTTRFLVYRPQEDARFNGTVWIEWLNVSGGVDVAPSWTFAHREFARRGAAWVGVSVQYLGVEGGNASLLGFDTPGLAEIDPARYGDLHHPGDRFSYDIYTQVSATVLEATGTLLEGLGIERLIGIGESQSAYRLTTYINDIDPFAAVHDGFLVHARAGGAAALDDDTEIDIRQTAMPVTFRDDLRVPVLCVQSEGDLVALDYRRARQEDGDSLVVWEIAGCSHADVYTFVAGPIDSGSIPLEQLATAWRPIRDVVGMPLEKLVNAGPQHYIVDAAVWHLERWLMDGVRPPAAPRLVTSDSGFVTDQHGNVRGGLRTPHVEVPTAMLSGLGNNGSLIAFLCGTTEPFDAETLRNLYGSHGRYIELFSLATDTAMKGGFILPEDAFEVKKIAEINSPL